MEVREDKLCPWCNGEVKMYPYLSAVLLGGMVKTKSEVQWVPVCKSCNPPDLRVIIDVPTEAEAWAQWNMMEAK